METPDFKFNIPDDWFKYLDYEIEPFNNPEDIANWVVQGYGNRFTGAMCDMRKPQPDWTKNIVVEFSKFGWSDIGTSFYRMDTGTVLPVHADTYKKYIELYNLKGKEHTIRRAIIFLEDWKSGHYLEIDNVPYTNWKQGDSYYWIYDKPHMAANIGLEPRYTLQITGHK
jgi:hypothetical protein